MISKKRQCRGRVSRFQKRQGLRLFTVGTKIMLLLLSWNSLLPGALVAPSITTVHAYQSPNSGRNILKAWTEQLQTGYERRLSADPSFAAKSITEVLLAAGTQLAAEWNRRGNDRLLVEIDFVVPGVLSAVFGKYYRYEGATLLGELIAPVLDVSAKRLILYGSGGTSCVVCVLICYPFLSTHPPHATRGHVKFLNGRVAHLMFKADSSGTVKSRLIYRNDVLVQYVQRIERPFTEPCWLHRSQHL